MKKAVTVIIIAVILLMAVSCSAPSEQADQVVATVNGQPIYQSDWNELYLSYKQLLMYYYSLDATTEEGRTQLEEYKTAALDSLIEKEIVRQQVMAQTFAQFTDEQKAEAKKQVKEAAEVEIKSYAQKLKESSPELSDGECYSQAKAAYERDLTQRGESLEQKAQELLYKQAEEQLYRLITDNQLPSEADISEKYSALLEYQKAIYDEDVEQFIEDYDLGTSIIVYFPHDYIKFQHILISFSSDNQEEIQELYYQVYQEKDESKQKELDRLLAEGAESIQERTDSIYALAKDGDFEQFAQLVSEHSEDEAQKTEEACLRGYLTGEGAETYPDIHEKILTLAEGEIGTPVLSIYGYHIIRRDISVNAGAVELSEVKEDITNQLTAELEESIWQAQVKEWTVQAQVEKYTDKYDIAV